MIISIHGNASPEEKNVMAYEIVSYLRKLGFNIENVPLQFQKDAAHDLVLVRMAKESHLNRPIILDIKAILLY